MVFCWVVAGFFIEKSYIFWNDVYLKEKDKRVESVNEALANFKEIKMCNLEGIYEKNIGRKREIELTPYSTILNQGRL